MGDNSKFDFKNSMKNNTKKEVETPVLDTNTTNETETLNQESNVKKFIIGKKQEDKSVKKSFPLYTDGEKQKKLDKICKRTGYSRNELINMMIDHCLENIEFVE